MHHYRAMNYLVFVTLVLSFSLGGCQLFGPPNVEVVVPSRVQLNGWSLSPEGDKLVYGSQAGEFTIYLLLTETGRLDKLDDCVKLLWLDNETLYCGESVIIFNEDIPYQVPLNIVKAAEVDVAEILQAVDNVYKIDRVSTFFLALDDDIQQNPDNNYVITEVDHIEAVLVGVDYITLHLHRSGVKDFEHGEKVYAPNKEYYFIWEHNTKLSIFETATDERLSEFDSGKLLELGGWTADSSGVYFQTHAPTFFTPSFEPNVLRKLRVP